MLTDKQRIKVEQIAKTADSSTIALGWYRRGRGKSASVTYEVEGVATCDFLFYAVGDVFRARYYESAQMLGLRDALKHTLK